MSFSDFSPLGKILTGVGLIAAAPVAVVATIPVSATLGAVAVSVGVSSSVVASTGAAAAITAGTSTIKAGKTAIVAGVKDAL